jgi:SnoaL-like domain
VSIDANPTPTIDQLLAIEACREAARRYSYGVDRLDVEVMRSAYWPDAVDDHGVFVGNAWEFCERVVDSHDRWTWTMHTIFNHRVAIDPDGMHARGEAYNVSYLFEEPKRRLSTWYGRYLDTYERRGDEWRIAHRVCVHHGDVVQHLPESMPIDARAFRQADFDRPAHQREFGP